MYYRTCEICGIRAGRVSGQKRTFMAKFPLDEYRCKRWVQVTGNEDLAYVPIEKLHQLKYICGNHFRPKDFKKKKTQLKKNAVPSVFISAKPLPDEILMGFPLHIVEPSKSTAVMASVGMGTIRNIQYSSTIDFKFVRQRHSDHTYYYTGSAANGGSLQFHTFPNPNSYRIEELERFRTWVMRIGGNIVAKANSVIFNNARVCDRHFEDIYKYPTGRLNRLAIPSLYLPAICGPGKNPVLNTELQSKSAVNTLGKPLAKTGTTTRNVVTLEEVHNDHAYSKTVTPREWTVEIRDIGDKKEIKLDRDIKEAGNLTKAETFDNDDIPHSPEPEFTTETVTDIGENIINEDPKENQVFSWQKTELIEADESEDLTSAAVPEQPKTYEDLTLSLFCDEPEPRPLSPELCELVAVVPEDVEYRCKDCETVIDGFSFWCVQCRRGAMCCACAARAPHDAHYVLRAPRGAAENRTLEILTVMRQQLLNENLLSLYEIAEDGVKVEVKEEPEECPSPPPQPAATPDPLAEESLPRPGDVQLQADSHPDLLGDEPRSDQCLDEENIEHDHPFKRPRLMEHSQTLKPNSTATTNDVQKLKVPTNIVQGRPTVQTLPCDPRMPQDVVLATTSGSSGTQAALNITANDPSGPQTVVEVAQSNLKELQNFLLTTTKDPEISKDILNAITSDLKGVSTILQVIPINQTELQTHQQGSDTVQQVDLSQLSGSDVVLQVDPSNLDELLANLNLTLQNETSEQLGSLTALQVDSSYEEDAILVSSSGPKGSQIIMQIAPGDLERLQSSSIESLVLQEVSPGDCTASQSLPNVTASDRTESELVMMRTREMFQGSDFSGPETYKKLQPKIIQKTKPVLKLEKVQGIPKDPAIIKPINSEPITRFKVPQNFTRGVSAPLKVTSGTKSAETVITNLDDADIEEVEFLEEESEEIGLEVEDVEFLEEESEETGLEVGHKNDNEHISKKRKVENLITSDNATSDHVSESELEDDGHQEDIEDTKTGADSVTDVGSEVDDSDLDKDYAVEDDKFEESTDDTDVESIAERGVGRRTRNATKTAVETPSQATVRMLTSKAVVQVKPLTSLEMTKWMPNRKRPRKD